jgi:enoyl-CoA hydratase/carnithine racemase
VLAERVEAHGISIVRRMGHVQVERDGGVVTVTLSNPGRKNALPGSAWPELEAACRAIAGRRDDRCVVLTGACDDFCSGADVSQPTPEPAPPAAPDGRAAPDGEVGGGLRFMRTVSAAVEALHALPQPLVARVAGVCVGAGMNLALACDIVIASDDARFSEIFARRALSIDGGGSWVLPRIVGLQKAKELALLAEIVPADRAEQLGLVTRVVSRAELDATVADVAGRLAAGPPLALQATKRLLNEGVHASLADAVEAEAQAQTANFGTHDTAEAMAAFVQKRQPTFEGR